MHKLNQKYCRTVQSCSVVQSWCISSFSLNYYDLLGVRCNFKYPILTLGCVIYVWNVVMLKGTLSKDEVENLKLQEKHIKKCIDVFLKSWNIEYVLNL